jgi:hypothetical protein
VEVQLLQGLGKFPNPIQLDHRSAIERVHGGLDRDLFKKAQIGRPVAKIVFVINDKAVEMRTGASLVPKRGEETLSNRSSRGGRNEAKRLTASFESFSILASMVVNVSTNPGKVAYSTRGVYE